jgi:hypothetical protein
MTILALMLCAMLAGAAPLAMLFVVMLLAKTPDECVPEPEPEYVFDPEYEANLQAHLQHMRDCVEFGWDW